MADAIIDPSFEINGAILPIIPNSTLFRVGTGTSVCVAQSTGNGSTEAVHKVDKSAAVGYVSTKMENTTTNMKLVESYVAAGSNIKLLFTDAATGYKGSMTNGRLINEVEYAFGVDGDATLEFCGNTITQSF